MKAKILIIDDEESIRFTLENFLSKEGYEVVTAKDFTEAVQRLDGTTFDVIFTDILLGEKTGIDLLREIRKGNIFCPVIMITGYPNIDTATEAVRLGAFDYISKPVTQETLLHSAGMALQYKKINDERERFRSNLEAIFRSIKDAIITVDKELTVVELNDAAKDICGFSHDMQGRPFSSLPHKCNGKCLQAVMETIRTKGPVEMLRHECHRNDRYDQVVTINTSPLISRGIFSGVVLVIKDETRLTSLERDMKERRQFHNIVGKSDKMQKIYSLIEDLSEVQTTVLITGESGTGKELIAEALHYKGSRRYKPLVKVNCSALPENLLESELFGHVKGA
ncbi:MAG: response regulator, partial [Nitrospirae bacterium]|nr:response regulator [Nitrospirota bacterium]